MENKKSTESRPTMSELYLLLRRYLSLMQLRLPQAARETALRGPPGFKAFDVPLFLGGSTER